MARKRREGPRSRQLVLGYLERISSQVFSEFPRELTDLVGERHGVYALYKGDRLYYVGLAANLRYRIGQHLRDRHARKWDKFSLYLVRRVEHIRELESLVLRIADPRGNATKGRLPRADNLRPELKAKIRKEQDRQRGAILGTPRRKQVKATERTPRTVSKKAGAPPLAAYVKKPFRLRATYKNKTYEARVRTNGMISYRGTLYNSPSGAGQAVTGKPSAGWHFWRYRNEDGEWVKLAELRKQNPSKTTRGKRTRKEPPLKAYVTEPFTIRATYKGKTYEAKVGRDGKITYKGTAYDSPSGAGRAVTGHPSPGWHFWRYRNEAGEWVKLRELRQGGNP